MTATGTLTAGRMGKPDDPATVPPEFAGSMAANIEAVFAKVSQDAGMPPLILTTNTVSDRDRRLIFVAIAQGVVEYLVANPDAFQITDTFGTTLAITISQADPL